MLYIKSVGRCHACGFTARNRVRLVLPTCRRLIVIPQDLRRTHYANSELLAKCALSPVFFGLRKQAHERADENK